MNKKLVMGGVLGLVAIGAGAFAVSGLGGGSEEAPARQARAESKGSDFEPTVFESEGGFFATLGDGKVVKLADPMKPAPSAYDAVPSTSNGPSQAQPEDEQDAPEGEADGPTNAAPTEGAPVYPTIPDGGPAGGGDDNGDAPGSAIIYNAALIDAICKAIGCDAPTITPPSDLADSICDITDCDGEQAPPDKPITRPCDLTGDCVESTPDIPIIQFKGMFSPKN